MGHAMQSGPIDYRIQDGFARLQLRVSGRGNAVGLELARRFRDVTGELLAAEPRAVVVSGAGDIFCGGGDVREMAAADDIPAFLDELVSTFHEGLLQLARVDAVIIAAIDGPAAGAGLGLALNADVRIASSRARFVTAYETIGLTPDSGVTYLLPRAIGAGRASAMAATSQRVDAPTALEMGLVSEVVPADRFDARIDEVAAAAAALPQSHMAATRRLLRGDLDGAYASALEAERIAIMAAARVPTTAERIRSFGR
jgi:2-(1,2-epoxy-1,2-dihydrophenyl)acetyl-CoA isomerase